MSRIDEVTPRSVAARRRAGAGGEDVFEI